MISGIKSPLSLFFVASRARPFPLFNLQISVRSVRVGTIGYLVTILYGRYGQFFARSLHSQNKKSLNMHSPLPPPRSPSRMSSAVSVFESNISKNSGYISTSRVFLSNVALGPGRRPPFPRSNSLTTAKDIENAYDQIIDDFKTNPLISPRKFHGTTVSSSMPGLPILSLFNDNYNADTNTEHVVSKEEGDEDASFFELDDEESIAESYQEPAPRDYSVEDFSEASTESYGEPAPGDDARVVVKEDAGSEASGETNVTEAESCDSDGERVTSAHSLLPSFEEQMKMLRLRDRKPVVPVSPIKLKDRMRAFQQDLTLDTL
jgi:hypothetical protein